MQTKEAIFGHLEKEHDALVVSEWIEEQLFITTFKKKSKAIISGPIPKGSSDTLTNNRKVTDVQSKRVLRHFD